MTSSDKGMPEEGATWDDWADALRVVKSELGLTSGLAMDRTAHRWAGPAFSYGAKFHENGVINDYADIFNLKEINDELETPINEWDGWGEQSWNNLLEAIEKAKKVDFANLIYSLGIRHVGVVTAQLLSEYWVCLKNRAWIRVCHLVKCLPAATKIQQGFLFNLPV